MIRLALPLFLFLSCVTAHARLDETVAECETRYGVSIEKRPAVQAQSDHDAVIYTKNSVTITVEFHQGKAWHITYRKRGMEADEIEAVLEAEGGGNGWSAPLQVAGQTCRTSSDHNRVALLQPPLHSNQPVTLVIATKEFAATNRAFYDEKLNEAAAQGLLQQRLETKGGKEF